MIEMNKQLNAVILSEKESRVDLLKDLLSDYYSLDIAFECRRSAEAIEYLNKHRPMILFLDTVVEDVLHNVIKPPFIVGLCDAVNIRRVNRFLKKGFFEILHAPYSERDLNSIMGKILNICGRYNVVDKKVIRRVEEESMSYRTGRNAQKSIFITGTRKEESTRVVFDEVLYMKKVGNEVCVFFDDGSNKFFRSNLKMFHAKFPEVMFQKVNRSVVVNMNKVTDVKKESIVVSKKYSFALSRSYRKQFNAMIET
jgi:DNA-binding LytR/AlgR family response regulator